MECSYKCFYGPRLRDVEGVLVRKFWMNPGLAIWKGTWVEITNGCEDEASYKVFLNFFQLDHDLEMWKVFWSGNVEWTRLSDLEGELVGNYE